MVSANVGCHGGEVPVEEPPAPDLEEAWRRIRQLETALSTRTEIAQAQGMLMERYGIDADAAIALLKRVSNGLNVRLRTVAANFVAARQLPESVLAESSSSEREVVSGHG